jgi:hypothetical protein
MLKGLDILGLARHDDRAIASIIPPNYALGCLLGTFGDPLPKLERLLLTGKIKAVRVHLTNGCGQRNHNEEPQYEVKETDLRGFANRALKVQALKAKFPAVDWYVSPRLEYDEANRKIVDSWFEVIRNTIPGAIPVASCVSGYRPASALVEIHGNGARGDIISNDGASLSDAPSTYCAGARKIAFGWLHTMNGRGPGDKTFVPPSKRPNNAFSTPDDLRYCVEWLNGIEPKPIVSGKDIKAPEILKPYGEYYSMSDDWKEKHPALLSLQHLPGFTICTVAGKVIGQARRVDPPLGKLYRYYADALAPRLRDKAGSQWTVWISGKTTYLVNLFFRQGAMHG